MTGVVFLTCHLPYPETSGGRLREHELLVRLADRYALHVVAVSKTPVDDVRNAPRLRRRGIAVTVLPADGSRDCSTESARQVAVHGSSLARRIVWTLCTRRAVDVVHVEGFYLAQHVSSSVCCPTLLVEQNAEFALWQQRAALGEPGAELEAERTLAAERAAWRNASLVATVTEDDRAAIRALEPSLDVRVVPDGADHLTGAVSRGRDPGTVVFVANYGYSPNVDAALHLLRDVWPSVRARAPHARLKLVGGGVRLLLSDAAADDPHVEVTGRVPAVAPFLDAADVVVCPLRIGGGVKVKVLEALSRGAAVVTTSVGTQGLGDGAKRATVVAEEPGSFADAVVRLLFDGRERARLQAAASAFARTLTTWDESAQRLAEIYDELAVTTPAMRARAATTAAPSSVAASPSP